MPLSARDRFSAAFSSSSKRRRCAIAVDLLEGRVMMAGDLTAPVTVAEVVPNTLNATGYYTSSPSQVNLLAVDPDSPVGISTFYSIDNAAFVPGNSFLLGDGDHTIAFFSVDASGNQEMTHVVPIRIDSTTPVVTASASPNVLFPPNHKPVLVTISGQVADASGGLPREVRYSIVDEYNPSSPRTGTAPVDATGHYTFRVPLQASRLGQDRDGRLYTIFVSATDQAGNTGSTSTSVVVPHDRGNHGGGKSPGHDRGGDQRHGGPGHKHRRPHGNAFGHIRHQGGKARGPQGPGNDDGGRHGNGNDKHGNGNEDGNHGNGNGNGNEDGNHGNGNGNGKHDG